MTLQQLSYLVALDNTRHFVRAAEVCHVTQPTLTMQVKKLEDEIGVMVFDRDARPLTPTPAGAHIIAKARQILREVEQLKAFVNDELSSLIGAFRLGVIPTLGPYLMPMFLPDFARSHPNSRLNVQEMLTSQIISGLKQGTLDLGIAVTPLEERELREIPLFYEPFWLYLPKGHPLAATERPTAGQIPADELLLLEEGHCFREQALAICQHRPDAAQMPFHYQSGSIEALKGLVDRGQGCTLVPELALPTRPHDWIRRLADPQPVREVSLIVHRTFTKEALIEAIFEQVSQHIPGHLRRPKKFTRVRWR